MPKYEIESRTEAHFRETVEADTPEEAVEALQARSQSVTQGGRMR